MEIYNSILELSQLIPATPDEILMIFAHAVLLYELLSAIIFGVGIWLAYKLMHWIFKIVQGKKQ